MIIKKIVDAASTPEGKIAVQFQLSAHAIDVHAQAAKESTVMILADESFNPASLVAQGMVVMNSVKSKASDSFNHLLILAAAVWQSEDPKYHYLGLDWQLRSEAQIVSGMKVHVDREEVSMFWGVISLSNDTPSTLNLG
ncbi:band-7 C-terminal domain-containing protein [Vibrio sp. DNB22_17_1]